MTAGGAVTNLVLAHHTYDTVIVITHLEIANELPARFSSEALGVNREQRTLNTGEMAIVDCSRHRIRLPIDDATAIRYAKKLRELARPKALLATYLFGSIARTGAGRDADIIIEVPARSFHGFADRCIGALDGFHPVEKVMMPMDILYWSYFSPEEARFDYAMTTIGIDTADARAALAEIIPDGRVDLLCLPKGWNQGGKVEKLLTGWYNLTSDPKFLAKVIVCHRKIS